MARAKKLSDPEGTNTPDEAEEVQAITQNAGPEFSEVPTIRVWKGEDHAVINESDVEAWKRAGWSPVKGGSAKP